jgi:hypothetical protein
MRLSSAETCPCQAPDAGASVFVSQSVGVDTTAGRFGDVSLLTCKTCGSLWLHYYVVYEGVSRSGRWFRGQIPPALTEELDPLTATQRLAQLPGYFYGGSYFASTGQWGKGPVPVDS